jgi:O-antigen ligase
MENITTDYKNYPHLSSAVIFMFCGYVITWYLQLGTRWSFFGAIRFEFIYAACLTLIALSRFRMVSFDCPLIKYIILYFIVIIIQVPFSHNFDESWNVFVNRIVKFSFMAWFIIFFVTSPRNLKFFLGAFLLACGKMGQEGFVGKWTGNMMWQNQGVMRLHGSTPLYFHPNSFSGMALGTFPFIYSLWPLSNRYVKIFLFGLAIFGLNIILFTASRTGYVGFLLLVLFILYKGGLKKKIVIGVVIFGLLAINFAPSQYIERFTSIFTQEEKEGNSIGARKVILEDAWAIFLDHPFGIGVGAFPTVRYYTFGRFQDTHNLYLEVATNLGIQGLIVFIIFVLKILKILKKLENSIANQLNILDKTTPNLQSIEKDTLLKNEHIRDLKLMKVTCTAVYLFVIVRLSLGLFGMDLYEIYWWFASGLTIALYNMNKVANSKTQYFLYMDDNKK